MGVKNNGKKDSQFQRGYHLFISILLLLSGTALLGIGIWLTVTGQGNYFELEFETDYPILQSISHANVAAFLLGGILVFVSLLGLGALARSRVGVTLRVVYAIAAVVLLAGLVALAVLCSYAVANVDKQSVKTGATVAWGLAVQNETDIICDIERRLTCRGFNDNDCDNCPTPLSPNCNDQKRFFCADCAPQQPANAQRGCFRIARDLTYRIALISAVAASIAATLVFIDITFLFCL